MGVTQSTTLNDDSAGKLTSGEYGDAGNGTSRWYQWKRTDDGGNVALGATDDAAITNPATDGTLVAFTRGVLTKIAEVATGLGTTTDATETDDTVDGPQITFVRGILARATAILAAFKAEDAAHTTGDLGIQALAVRRDTAAASSGTDGDYEPLQTDATGHLRTLAQRDPDDALSIAATSALASSLVVKASAGTLHSIVGYVASGEAGYVQVHDATSVPADTSVPELSYYVGAGTDPQPVNIPLPGHACGTGIVVVWSTAGPTKTLGSAKMMIAAYYE